MYEEFYKLNQRPFLTVPDPGFLYWSNAHLMAFTMLRFGIMSRAPLTVITGEIGAGKTTLLRQLLNEVSDDVAIGLISNMQAGRGELIDWVLSSLGEKLIDGEPYVSKFKRFQDLVIEAYASGKRVILIFDEAQNLDVASLEEMRMLTNINADSDELLQLILVGQPQLRDLLSRPELVQFSQRISSDFHLSCLTKSEVSHYISRRLQIAGSQWEIFSPKSCDVIFEATGGVPRLINILCDLCLVYGYSGEHRTVEPEMVFDFLSSAERQGIYTQFKRIKRAPKLVREANSEDDKASRG